MIKQLSSLDIHFLLRELKSLENSRVDKIYNNGKEEIYIQFYKGNVGKIILKIIVGKALFTTKTKLADEKPSEFCMMLRKHLGGKTLSTITQLEPERIIKIIFKETKKLYLEFFGKGNVILCTEDDVIIDSIIRHKFRDRAILPKQNYKYPNMQYNLFDIDEKELNNLLKNSEKDKLIASLAVELGLGGLYAEEICLFSNLDKNKIPKKIDDRGIIKSIKKVIKKKVKAQILYKGKELIDIVPVQLEFYKNYEQKKFPDFSSALDYYFTKLRLRRESPYEKQIKELKRIIEGQKFTIESLKNKEKENREKAELIYNNYQLIGEILGEINKANKKYSWNEIKKKLKEHKIVKDLDVKEKRIVVETD